MSHIIINELTIHVPGTVVKTSEGGMSKLRVTQEQAQHIYDQLGPVLDFFKSQDNPIDALRQNVGQKTVEAMASIPVTAAVAEVVG